MTKTTTMSLTENPPPPPPSPSFQEPLINSPQLSTNSAGNKREEERTPKMTPSSFSRGERSLGRK